MTLTREQLKAKTLTVLKVIEKKNKSVMENLIQEVSDKIEKEIEDDPYSMRLVIELYELIKDNGYKPKKYFIEAATEAIKEYCCNVLYLGVNVTSGRIEVYFKEDDTIFDLDSSSDNSDYSDYSDDSDDSDHSDNSNQKSE